MREASENFSGPRCISKGASVPFQLPRGPAGKTPGHIPVPHQGRLGRHIAPNETGGAAPGGLCLAPPEKNDRRKCRP